MSDFDKYSSLQPPSDVQERVTWLRQQEERIANLVRRKLVALIVDATESFNRSLTASGDMSVFDSIPTQWSSWVDDVLLEELQGMYLAGGLLAYETSSASGVLSDSVTNLWVEVVNQNAADYALTAQNRMKDVGMTAWNDIKNKVSKSIETGTSVEDLKTLLEKNRSFSEFRADTIARTETLNAYNNGNWEGNQALGEYGPTHKYWMATLDGRARGTHVAVDNEVVPINEPFVVGGEAMMYPHSPGASAKNVVNCRCTYGVLWPGDPHPVTGEPIGQATPVIMQATIQPSSSPLLDELQGTVRYGSGDEIPGTREFIARLSNDEVTALRRYTGSAYEDLNYNLRQIAAGRSGYDLTPDQQNLIRHLDSAIAKAGTREPVITYRGMGLPDPPIQGWRLLPIEEQRTLWAEHLAEKYPVGSRVDFGGQYVSTGTDIAAPLDASLANTTNPGVIFEIEARSGATLKGVSKFEDEYEILLGRDSQFEVVRVEGRVTFEDEIYERTSVRTVVVLREIV